MGKVKGMLTGVTRLEDWGGDLRRLREERKGLAGHEGHPNGFLGEEATARERGIEERERSQDIERTNI